MQTPIIENAGTRKRESMTESNIEQIKAAVIKYGDTVLT